MIEIREGTEELGRSTHLVTNHEPTLLRAFDGELLDNWAIALLNVPHDLLVNIECVLRCLLKEGSIGYRTDVGSAVNTRRSAEKTDD